MCDGPINMTSVRLTHRMMNSWQSARLFCRGVVSIKWTLCVNSPANQSMPINHTVTLLVFSLALFLSLFYVYSLHKSNLTAYNNHNKMLTWSILFLYIFKHSKARLNANACAIRFLSCFEENKWQQRSIYSHHQADLFLYRNMKWEIKNGIGWGCWGQLGNQSQSLWLW